MADPMNNIHEQNRIQNIDKTRLSPSSSSFSLLSSSFVVSAPADTTELQMRTERQKNLLRCRFSIPSPAASFLYDHESLLLLYQSYLLHSFQAYCQGFRCGNIDSEVLIRRHQFLQPNFVEGKSEVFLSNPVILHFDLEKIARLTIVFTRTATFGTILTSCLCQWNSPVWNWRSERYPSLGSTPQCNAR